MVELKDAWVARTPNSAHRRQMPVNQKYPPVVRKNQTEFELGLEILFIKAASVNYLVNLETGTLN